MNEEMMNDSNVIREALIMKILQQFQNFWKNVMYWKNRVNSITYDEIYADCREKL